MHYLALLVMIGLLGCQTQLPMVQTILSGTTVRLDDGRTVQYAGLESPAAGQPQADLSHDANQYLVWNKSVQLVIEPQMSPGDPLVAYVYTPVIVGTETKYLFVNAELARFGFARVLPLQEHCTHPDLWRSLLDLQEQEAKPGKLGLWGR